MPIVFSDHAKEQLKRRRINQKIVLEVVKNPEKAIASFRGRKLRQARIRGKLLEIVTKTEGSRITIITGYFVKE